MNAKRDWGYAADYVEAMYLMLQHDTPDDYVVASGINYSVRDFVNVACNELDMKIEWEGEGLDEKVVNTLTGKTILKVNSKYYRPAEVETLLGDASKAKKVLNWQPKTSFDTLVSMMIKADYDKLIKV